MSKSKLSEAREALARATENVAEAEAAKADALGGVEYALAELGWTRVPIIQSPGSTLRYQHAAYSSSLTVDEVEQLIEQQKRALA